MTRWKAITIIHKKKLAYIAAACLALTVFLAGCEEKGTLEASWLTTPKEEAETAAPQETQGELSVTDLVKAVVALKGDLESAIEDIQENKLDGASETLGGIAQKTQTIRASLDATMRNLGDGMQSFRSQLENIQGVLDLVDIAVETILKPAVEQLQGTPLDRLRTEEGADVRVLCEYLDFAESLMPDIETLVAHANTLDLSIVDSDRDITRKLETANEWLEMYQNDRTAFDHLRAMLGENGDRVYLIAAQNSAEIRASGGFPGAMGVVRIENGILTVDDFKKVYDVLSSYTPVEAKVTNQEASLFHGGLSAPRDADYCPDFERVAYIWSLGYEEKQKESVDGVIAVTPVLVQRLLGAMDDQITLFDGLTMDGTNACRVLQYDLYYKYFGREYVANRATLADQLFADAAKKTALLLMDHMGGDALSGYLDVAGESLNDRTMMIWMKDEQEQALIRAMGWGGGLNDDPQKPEAGVYVNCTIASKMGIFLEIDTEIGEPALNESGSYCYPITVTFHNSITQEEVRGATAYITGGTSGSFSGSAYFFAPAGGTIGGFTSEQTIYIREDTYKDLALGFMPSLHLSPGQSMTITYEVTTAPGVETPLGISQTPTIQDYR